MDPQQPPIGPGGGRKLPQPSRIAPSKIKPGAHRPRPDRAPPPTPLAARAKSPTRDAAHLVPAEGVEEGQDHSVPPEVLGTAAKANAAGENAYVEMPPLPLGAPPAPPNVSVQEGSNVPFRPGQANVSSPADDIRPALQAGSRESTERLRIQEGDKKTSLGASLVVGLMDLYRKELTPENLNELGYRELKKMLYELVINFNQFGAKILPTEEKHLTSLNANIHKILDYLTKNDKAEANEIIQPAQKFVMALRKASQQATLAKASASHRKPSQETSLQIQTLLHRMREKRAFEMPKTLEQQHKIVTPTALLYGYRGAGITTSDLLQNIHDILKNQQTPLEEKKILLGFVNQWLEKNIYQTDLKDPQVQVILKGILDLKFIDPELTNTIAKAKENFQIANKKINESVVLARDYPPGAPEIDDLLTLVRIVKTDAEYTDAVKKFANELRATWLERLSTIDISDYFNYKSQDASRAPKISKLFDEGNNFMSWIAEKILPAPNVKPLSPEEKGRLFKFLVDTADEAQRTGDFYTTQMIIGGLNQAALSRLSNTNLPKNDKTTADFARLNLLINPELKSKNLRLAMGKYENQPHVAYLGIANGDLDGAKDGNPDTVDNEINVAKINLIARLATSFQNTIENAKKGIVTSRHEVKLGDMLKTKYDVNKQYARSLAIQPRI